MLLTMNPTDDQIAKLISLSKDRAVKWIEYNGNRFVWPSDAASHAAMAHSLRIANLAYEKGIMVQN